MTLLMSILFKVYRVLLSSSSSFCWVVSWQEKKSKRFLTFGIRWRHRLLLLLNVEWLPLDISFYLIAVRFCFVYCVRSHVYSFIGDFLISLEYQICTMVLAWILIFVWFFVDDYRSIYSFGVHCIQFWVRSRWH